MKKLKLGIGLVIVIVLGCWVASRWHTWFVEEDEEAYVASSSPVHVLLTFGDAQPLSRNVSWQADSSIRPSWLELVCLADSDTIRVEAPGWHQLCLPCCHRREGFSLVPVPYAARLSR